MKNTKGKNRLRPYPQSNTTELKGVSRDYKRVACDVCGFFWRRMDCTKVTDPLSVYQLNMVVCKECFDIPNPQIRIRVIEDVLVTKPDMVREPQGVYGSLNDPSKL